MLNNNDISTTRLVVVHQYVSIRKNQVMMLVLALIFSEYRVNKQLRHANGTFLVSALTLLFHGHVWNNCQ